MSWILLGAVLGTLAALVVIHRENTKERREAERRAGVDRYLRTLDDR